MRGTEVVVSLAPITPYAASILFCPATSHLSTLIILIVWDHIGQAPNEQPIFSYIPYSNYHPTPTIYFTMETYANLLSNNLGSLLSRCHISKDLLQYQINTLTSHPSKDHNRTSSFNLLQPTDTVSTSKLDNKSVLHDKIIIINNHSLRKLQATHRKKRSLESLFTDQLPHNIRRYNMSKDAKIDFALQQTERPKFYKTPTPTPQVYEDNPPRRQKNTKHLVKSKSKKSQISEALNATTHLPKMPKTFEFDYEIAKPRQYTPKRKLWSSDKVVIGREVSPSDQFTITNSNYRKICNKSSLDYIPVKDENLSLTEPVNRLSQEHSKTLKRQKLRPLVQTVEQQTKSKVHTRSRHCKQLFLQRMFKKDDGICAWDIEEEIVEAHSPLHPRSYKNPYV